MSQERLQEAIRLRSAGQAEQARTILMELLVSKPDDPVLNYQMAWTCDNLGLEHEAIPFYTRAIEHGLSGDDLAEALLGLGSSYRALGEYQRAVEILQRGVAKFPQHRAMQAFLAMALYNHQHYREAMELLLRNLAESSADTSIQHYQKALLFYAPRLDEVDPG
ncbi:tetratricopeptide repeat protein [Ktedonosporobacter rubrisoli]|uniref:Tetratricopeptide repeat protein n=1 Tax=Ktedonosporobacter rubrisoli TaxID=2509675 RepID=A0A4P6JYW3_KTERU|nr:tetratricopeptide repeat protein [Ktedonosporobacter rubrisoli]QBD80937.1 tetratricopeptide repeat protein [Ktedonosporobacter rubrisoli]